MQKIIPLGKEELLQRLWKAERKIHSILVNAKHPEEARYILFDHFDRLARDVYNMRPDTPFAGLNIVEKRNVRECLRVVANTLRTENEHAVKFSPVRLLYGLAHKDPDALARASEGFIAEYLALFQGIRGTFGKHAQHHELLRGRHGRAAAIERSSQLDDYSGMMQRYFRRYRSGLTPVMEKQRAGLRREILRHFGGTAKDWRNYKWHLGHIVRDGETLASLLHIEDDERAGLEMALKNRLPFEITPHYLSLFNREGRTEFDRAVRAQVIPSERYCHNVLENWKSGRDMDFMGEKVTSPIDGVTRRYPQIVIIKPFNACPQVCVYCQRNWEIKSIDDQVMMPRRKVEEALAWIRDNRYITEVLVTGGDPLTLDNDYLEWLLGELAGIRHLERIRIGTRTPVTLPMRFENGLLKMLARFHEWGRREIAIVTHFEHPAEMTADNLAALRRLKRLGLNVYNQQVFTFYNSRKFETAYLRKVLKLCGVDPYYSFNCMGKEETIDFRVPIARIEQERREEARLLPGVVRTDEPVFNVPRLGKSHLRAWQDHEVVSILADGRRVYRFYSWETQLTTSKDYLYTDVSIYDYLKRIDAEHGNVEDYVSIWYYF